MSTTTRRPSPLAATPAPRWPLARLALALAVAGAPALAARAAGQETASTAAGAPLTLTDLMKLRQIEDAALSKDGEWVSYALVPDRGDGEAVARRADDPEGGVFRIERGTSPAVSRGGGWLAALVQPPLAVRLAAEEEDGDEDAAPKTDLELLALSGAGSGEERVRFSRVKAFAFSPDGAWVARHHREEEEPAAGTGDAAGAVEEAPGHGAAAETPEAKDEHERLGTRLVLRRLSDGLEIEVPRVESWAFDATGAWLAYAVAGPGGAGNGVYLRGLREDGVPERVARRDRRGRYTALTWTGDDASPSRLAFVAAVDAAESEEGEAADGEVWLWDGAGRRAARLAGGEPGDGGWYVPSENSLTFSRDGRRLFFGRKPEEERSWVEEDEEEAERKGGEEKHDEADPYDLERLREKATVTVWHGDDPRIQPNQKQEWKELRKRTYLAVAHLGEAPTGGDVRVVPLADRELREVQPSDNARAALGLAPEPYFRERTWEGSFSDAWWVDLRDGSRRLVARRLARAPELSPGGRYAVFWDEQHWHLFDAEDGSVRNLTGDLPVAFADEEHDYPSPPPGYGVAGWLEGDAAVLIYDRYDVWEMPTAPGGEAFPLTGGEGRKRQVRFRRLDLDPDRDSLRPGEEVLLSEYDERMKSHGFARARTGRRGAVTLVHEPKRFRFLARAEEADRILYTRESYREFPDVWVADLAGRSGLALERRRRISDANPGLDRYAWGEAELVRWESADGTPLDGVLIKPGGYREGQRYPVIVYFYRFFSQRLHEFNEPVVNHRPSFPYYASHGYAVFLPDIRFEVGRPGLSAVKALVPGVQKLVDMGVADPDAIGLHGHSWSGYQTAFVVTQTNIFAAAVAGAPVSNMTSAYGGIRYGTGLARQFQYERTQSRLGGSLWEARHAYVENSPLFYADRIETPLLIEFGDEDGAVPWTQGIELYLALRRLDRDVVFLQYGGEPHHLQQYPNKVDYTIRMKEFFDHHLKGVPAPAWMTEGVPYRGER